MRDQVGTVFQDGGLAEFYSETSFLPFGAVVDGRQRLTHLCSGGGEASVEWAGRCVRLRRIVCVRERPRRTAHPSAAVYAEPAETREALSSGSAFGVCRLAWSRWPRRPYPPLPHV